MSKCQYTSTITNTHAMFYVFHTNHHVRGYSAEYAVLISRTWNHWWIKTNHLQYLSLVTCYTSLAGYDSPDFLRTTFSFSHRRNRPFFPHIVSLLLFFSLSSKSSSSTGVQYKSMLAHSYYYIPFAIIAAQNPFRANIILLSPRWTTQMYLSL